MRTCLRYRDTYRLFNKNRSLYKIITTQLEKDDLIDQEILPYSDRSLQIAIVTAKSMFRHFGSRIIVNGRRVKDDYWEAEARKQGFTEEDLAGKKRLRATKAREAQAVEAATAAGSIKDKNTFSRTGNPGKQTSASYESIRPHFLTRMSHDMVLYPNLVEPVHLGSRDKQNERRIY